MTVSGSCCIHCDRQTVGTARPLLGQSLVRHFELVPDLDVLRTLFLTLATLDARIRLVATIPAVGETGIPLARDTPQPIDLS